MKICKDFIEDNTITSIEQWKELCPPAHKNQWVIGRSAFESARFWLRAENHNLVKKVLINHFHKIDFQLAAPEFKTPFDQNGGNDRNHDLFIKALDSKGNIFIGIEAKVDEPFGDVIAKTFIDASAKKIEKPESKSLKRIIDLSKNIDLGNSDLFWGLRYQLAYSIAGLIAHSKIEEVSRALFLVQTFKTNKYDKKKSRH
ncbi:MAG: hypothetical protein HZC10_05295 [Nitrospirae bacterium]|nr:hypothetical protein [Nitrospirota bacterium]